MEARVLRLALRPSLLAFPFTFCHLPFAVLSITIIQQPELTMSETMTSYEHEQLDTNGVPSIVGTNMKVVELVMAQLAHGWSPEELHFQHPYLSLGQIHSGLAYYWDHKA
jgi:uncharacterized protein (DUF433 family)